VILVVEGKKCRALGKDYRAVSEVYGQLLMMGIVVIAFSTIALTVFSDGALNQEHTPHTDLQENINTNTNRVYITHSGGEAIDLSAIKIILIADGKRYEFNKSDFKDPDDTEPDDAVFMLGDCIVINNENIKSGIDIDMLFVDMPSQQVIQRTALQQGPTKVPYWITPCPYGSVYDNSTNKFLPTELVDGMNDGLIIKAQVPKKSESIYQEFTFGINADEMGISDSSKPVKLKVIYRSQGCSPDEIPLSIYDGSEWTQIGPKMKNYSSFDDCKNSNSNIYEITSYVDAPEKLENLKVRFSATENPDEQNKKFYEIDFIGVHIGL
jgi:FlaG/FlaF family flagellin (archaellin)